MFGTILKTQERISSAQKQWALNFNPKSVGVSFDACGGGKYRVFRIVEAEKVFAGFQQKLISNTWG